MTPKENVEQIVGQFRDLIRNHDMSIGHIAKKTDLGYSTILRMTGLSSRSSKSCASMESVAALADYFGFEVALVPKGSK